MVNELMRLARERDRGYASYWKWPLDKAHEEGHVARTLLKYLEAHADWSVRSLATCALDPPDCVAELSNGNKLGIEVTELVHEKMVARHAIRRADERRGRPPHRKAAEVYDTALWTAPALRDRLEQIVRIKDVPPRIGPLDAHVVAIVTDETTLTPRC